MADEIIKIVDDLASRLGIAIDWSSKNMIPYLKELFVKYTNYEMATSIMWLIIFVITIIIGVLFAKWAFKYESEDGSVEQGLIAISLIVLFFACAFSIIGICCQTIDIIKCCTFPEKIILDYLRDFASK